MPRSTIRTKRLVLRPLSDADAPRIAQLGSDWDVASMTARMPYPYTQEAAHQWIGEIDPGEEVYGIELHGELIGVTGFTPAEDGLSAEVGYWLGKDYWGSGYATEAARAVIDHCFSREGFSFLTCGHFADNPASARVIRKLGFAETGSGHWWCEARRLEILAVRYELPRPRRDWRKFMGFGRPAR